MRTSDLAKALEEWAAEVLEINHYDTPPEELDQYLPLVICEVKRKRRKPGNEPTTQFQQHGFQQTSTRVWEADLILLITPDPAWTASHTLYDYVDTLEDSLYKDPTLGSRVGFAEKEVDASFDPPEVEYQDGTVARQATFTLAVGEQVRY